MTSLSRWWREEQARAGFWRTLWRFLCLLCQFARESMPAQRRLRYGDVDYDWDFRVDTTSATVGWHDRLRGLFHSPYQPTEPALFGEMMSALNVDFRNFTFIDIGSGKGRVLLMASDYPFRRILGIELFPAHNRIAQKNIRNYSSDSQQCREVESRCVDARQFQFLPEPTLLYLFNPLPESGLAEMLGHLERSLQDHPRAVYILYHNPLLEHVLTHRAAFNKISGTHQYSLFAAASTAADDRRFSPAPIQQRQ